MPAGHLQQPPLVVTAPLSLLLRPLQHLLQHPHLLQPLLHQPLRLPLLQHLLQPLRPK